MEKIGVIHYNFSFVEIEDFFKWCNENNLEYVELQRKDLWDNFFKIETVSKLLEKYKIKVSQLSCGNDFIQKTKDEFENQVKIVQTCCKIIKELGYNQLRIDGGWPKEDIDELKYKEMILEGIKRVVEIAEKENVFLVLDNHGQITNDYQFQLEVFEKINSKYLGANLDTMNYRWYGYPIEKLIDIYKSIAPYALHTHLKDGTGTRQNYIGKVFGEGEIPIKEAIKILKENKYKGVWCVEYEGKDKEIGYNKCVEILREYLNEQKGKMGK